MNVLILFPNDNLFSTNYGRGGIGVNARSYADTLIASGHSVSTFLSNDGSRVPDLPADVKVFINYDYFSFEDGPKYLNNQIEEDFFRISPEFDAIILVGVGWSVKFIKHLTDYTYSLGKHFLIELESYQTGIKYSYPAKFDHVKFLGDRIDIPSELVRIGELKNFTVIKGSRIPECPEFSGWDGSLSYVGRVAYDKHSPSFLRRLRQLEVTNLVNVYGNLEISSDSLYGFNYHGAYNVSELYPKISNSICISGSIKEGGFPVQFIESLSCGIPLILSRKLTSIELGEKISETEVYTIFASGAKIDYESCTRSQFIECVDKVSKLDRLVIKTCALKLHTSEKLLELLK